MISHIASQFICIDCGASPVCNDWINRARAGEFTFECLSCGRVGWRENFDGTAQYYDHLLNLPMLDIQPRVRADKMYSQRDKEIHENATPSFLLERGHLVK